MATRIEALRTPPPGTPMSVSLRSTRDLRTGSWRTLRPTYVTQASPCNQDCPAGTDVRRVLTLVAEGDVAGAWHTIREHNPLPGVCGRVCYHPCENLCNRAPLDGAVAVHSIERAIADEARARRLRPRALPIVLPPRLVAIVGSGPAGLSCAYHLARRGIGVTVFDAMARPGGMLRYGIPEYRLPRRVLDAEIALLHQMGVHFVCKTRVGAEIGTLGSFDAVFLALGLQQSKRVGLPGQHLEGVRSGLQFLREANAERADALSGPVVVIGGGNTALDTARMALRLGGEPTIVYRRARADMPAHPDEIAQAEAEGIGIVTLAGPLRFVNGGERLTAVEFQRMRPGAPDASGRARPEPIPGDTFTLAARWAFTAIGEELEHDELVESLSQAGGYLRADGWGHTRDPIIYAGGDAATGAGTVVEAIGSGRRAAEAIAARFLSAAPVPRDGSVRVEFGNVNVFYFPTTPRIQPPHVPAVTRIHGVDEVVQAISWSEAMAEASRCMSCGFCTQCDTCLTFCPDSAISRDRDRGGYAVDLNHCKGCGICATECPRGALVLAPEVHS